MLVATSARPALAARGAQRKRHQDKYWVADSGATESMTQDSSDLEDNTPPPPGGEVENAGGVFLPVAGHGRLRLLVDQDNGTSKGVTRELTLDRVAHNLKLGRQVQPSRLASACSFSALGLNLILTHGVPPAFRDGAHMYMHIPSTAMESVPSVPGGAIAYWCRSLPRVHRRRASSPEGFQVSSSTTF